MRVTTSTAELAGTADNLSRLRVGVDTARNAGTLPATAPGARRGKHAVRPRNIQRFVSGDGVQSCRPAPLFGLPAQYSATASMTSLRAAACARSRTDLVIASAVLS